MQSTKQSRIHPMRKRKGKGQSPVADTLTSAAFQEKVHRLDKLMQLAAAPTPKAPHGFTLIRKDSEPGTLEQVGQEADRAWAGVKKIMSLLNVEMKFIHVNSALNITYSGNMISDVCSLVTQGISGTQRTGDSIKVLRIKIKGVVQYNGTNTNVTLVVGRSKDGIPGVTDIFDLSGATSAQAGFSFPNDNQTQADKWLKSHFISSDQYHPNQEFEFDVKIGQDTQYLAGAATVSTGAVWFAAISGLNVLPPTVAYNYTMEYVDN